MPQDTPSHAGENRGSRLEAAVLGFALQHPQSGQARAAEALARQGFSISASGVRYIWRKHGLETTYKRLKAIQKSQGVGARALSEHQREILRRGDVGRRLARTASRQSEAGEAERRDLILAAAAELFVERGYGGASIRDIARRVGLLPGSVYHYFPAKEDIFVEVHHAGLRQLIARAEAAVARSDDPWLRLELACAEHVDAVVAGNAILQITWTGLFSVHETKLQKRLTADRERYEDIFRTLIAALDLPAQTDRSILRLNLLGALNWTRNWFRPNRKSPREIAHEIVTMFGGRQARPVADS